MSRPNLALTGRREVVVMESSRKGSAVCEMEAFEKVRRFCQSVWKGQVRKLGRQEDIDRLISRAEEADGSCLEERSFQQALEGPDETTWRCRHAGSHQYRTGLRKYSTQIFTVSLYRSCERFSCSKILRFLFCEPPRPVTRNGEREQCT